MYPSFKLMNEIKRSAGGRVGDESLERSLATIEGDSPIGALMSTLAVRQFRETMVDVAKNRPRSEILAWMTIAAAGPFRTRRALASRAVEIVAPHDFVDVLQGRGDVATLCAAQAEGAPSEDEWGAWLLLGQLRRRELRRFARAVPSLRRRLEESRRREKRPVNPQLRDQLQALGCTDSKMCRHPRRLI